VLRVFTSLVGLFAIVAQSFAYQPHLDFSPDRAAAQTGAQRAKDMVQFARVELNLKLDWSDASIAKIEELASELHADMRRERMALSDVETLVEMLGSYVGEVFRRNHGGEWGLVKANGKQVLAVKAKSSGTLLWPIERIRQRIRGGGGNNVWAYYQSRTALASQN
jgi:Domain of unknown function (DUF3806)